MPLMKNNHTLQPGAQKPQPGPLPTGPWKNRDVVRAGNLLTLQNPSLAPQFTVRVSITWKGGTYCVKPVVDEMFQVLAHSNLPHQFVFVPVHARELTHVGKDVLQAICQLRHGTQSGITINTSDITSSSQVYCTERIRPHKAPNAGSDNDQFL